MFYNIVIQHSFLTCLFCPIMYVHTLYIGWVKNPNNRLVCLVDWSWVGLVSDSESTDWTNRLNYRTNWTSNWTTGWTKRPERTTINRLIELNHSNERQTESSDYWQTATGWINWANELQMNHKPGFSNY